MAEVAYDLNKFAAKPKEQPQAPPRVKVSKGLKMHRRKQLVRAAKLISLCTLVVVLVCGVLYTNAKTAEIQTTITSTQRQIGEEEALNTYLNAQLGEMVNLRNIEEKARELGLVKMDTTKVNYIRVEDGSRIEVRQNSFGNILQNFWAGVLDSFGSAEEE